VDFLIHLFASFTMMRAVFPRTSKGVATAILMAGTVADLDVVSSFISPSAFLRWNHTYMHSIVGAILIATLVLLTEVALTRKSSDTVNVIKSAAPPIFAAAFLHLVMDFCQNDGMELLWPFRTNRFSADWVPNLDLWILSILIAGIGLPAIAGLVTEEIGAKSKRPRGQIGAILAFVAIFLYVSSRAIVHKGVIAEMQSVTYRGESPRRLAALAESSPFAWLGVFESERALGNLEINAGPSGEFDPNSAFISYKPEPSAALDAALRTESARRFLAAARFPKAAVEKTQTGFHVEIRNFPFEARTHGRSKIMASVDTDENAKILNQEIVWDPTSK
jgi:membrane-bound metal-dependent hydrolase YbcI (DUF457 family)